MFLGITRFSLFTPNAKGWNLSKSAKNEKSIEDYKKNLFDSSRLNERLNLFFNISLPSLDIIKKDYEYLHIIQISDQLPNYYKEKIQKYAENYSFLKIQEFDIYGNASKNLFDIINENIELCFEKKFVGFFNLDDDDLLALDFFDKTQKYINEDFFNYGISFGSGITGLISGNTVFEARESYKPKINIGLMKIGSVSLNGLSIPKNSNHIFIDKFMPTIIDSREVMYFWARHFNQDSSNSFNDTHEQLRIILNEFSKLNTLEVNSNIVDRFPKLNFHPNGSLRRELILNKKINSQDKLQIDLLVKNSRILIKVNYDILSKEGVLDPLRVGVLSFKFNEPVSEIAGLNLSSNQDIGLFRYFGAKENNNICYIPLVLPNGISLQSISARIWKYRGEILIKKIEILNLDNGLN